MKLSFKYSEREFVRAMNQANGDSKRLIVDFIIAIALLFYGLYLYINGSNEIFYSFIIVISIIFIFILFARMLIVPKLVFRKEPKYKEEYNLELNDENILFSAGALKSTIQWDFYKEIKETKDFIYLKYSKRGFAIIPKRVFNSSTELEMFKQKIYSKIK
ncbi:YcxB family protein [Paenibacillus sp. LHD-117]|uniref:YcxB family protein n=1 Tax=Paenibacillus sp. LHD-117 TaxID=3071412 RepID=UPI0027DEE49A|nr:YcxB family protein [Paenibacillus sp. LHD-117]MDQ6418004.1 YcxB family protein [Paenibacillus sp. LHD-117]